ncbi:ragulator complex protein LAMTOR4 [Centruroides vittatus]|uniref:ragulator complex protein LAMTOR4-like n=1 Tax=Centruroides sculpturatus TaxID=218467 RepID=UPI000C6EDD36|nr:ragulator complex protein LAMTOR4-like [Centruroides sculpturatus]XP_023228147.1 ragulator complex protein LAMTOR4-like [Centruroides sculpturatus]
MVSGLESIPQQTGYLVINEDGAVISSGGDLENDEHTANIISSMVQVADKSHLTVDSNEFFQTLSVIYDDHFYVVAVSNKKIHVVKRKYVPLEPVNV